ncbi:MAG: hypothetical protein AB2A00_43090 [Myxococcota bacterium]
MHVGGISHQWGTSRLWHDPNYEVSRDYRTPAVQKGIMGGEALPKEEHVLPPEKVADPFSVQEQAYDVAATQMARGQQGQQMLQGKPVNSAAFDAAVAAAKERVAQEDVTRTMISMQQAAQPLGLQQGQNVRPVENVPAAPGQVALPQGGAKTMAEVEAKQAAEAAKDASNAVDAVTMAGGGMVTAMASALKVPGSAVAANAVSAASAAATSATLAAGAANQAARPEDDPLSPVSRQSRE